MCGGVCPGHCADDVQLLEQSYAPWSLQIRDRSAQPLHSGDGYPGLAGLQHHHHGVDVRDGDTGVLSEAPGGDADKGSAINVLV